MVYSAASTFTIAHFY
ncbi:hypothetical protein [Citrobacter sedlakii]